MTEQATPHYTKEDMQELIRQFEGMVRGLNTKFSEDEIFKLVSLILANNIQNGVFTEEYVNLSKEAIRMRKSMGEELNPAQLIIVNDFKPRTKKL